MRETARCACVGALGLVIIATSLAMMPAQQKKTDVKKEAAPIVVDKPTNVAVDEGFLETLFDWNMIEKEISRIENAKGTVEIAVSIAELRERAAGKMAKLKGWMTDHKVPDDWSYDVSLRSFVPPAKSEAKGR